MVIAWCEGEGIIYKNLLNHFLKVLTRSLSPLLDFFQLMDHIDFPLEELRMGEFCTANALKRNVDKEKRKNRTTGDSNVQQEKRDNDPERSGYSDDVYDLCAVVNHHGRGIDKGHYTAYCRDADRGTWLLFNDVEVSVASAHDVRYILSLSIRFLLLPFHSLTVFVQF